MAAAAALAVTRECIITALAQGDGVLFAVPAMVFRPTYSGRNILAPNSSFSDPACIDSRGYVPVEWWVMSKTVAINEIVKPEEGLTRLRVGDRTIYFRDALDIATDLLLGDFSAAWPLTKVLDIGGAPVQPSFPGATEVPPIPAHVHAGNVVCGHCQGGGKLEAYFFPPLHVPPYNLDLPDVITRLGLKPTTTRDEVLAALARFGVDDSLYTLLNVFPVRAWESWTIPTHVVHAPGPWLTFEIQLPQDDYNLLAWQLGQPLSADPALLQSTKAGHQLRGISDEQALFDQTLKWDLNVDREFYAKWHRDVETLEAGDFGRRLRIFFHNFYGEGFEIKPKQTFVRKSDGRPFAAIVWSGAGTVNKIAVTVGNMATREFLVTPGADLTLVNTAEDGDLLIYSVFPILHTQ